ncbi:hypothetical protein BRD20_05835 [Halobacteriales archaeon SW_8_65_20]|nr:MAG: hypothetical protein BRD20_05835 [Halobacteriales archaeon SW_8_65_20]
MNRRTILTACGTAIAGTFAGCNSSDPSKTTATESSTATQTTTAKPTPTPVPADPEVTAALETARPKAAAAFESLQSMQVIKDGEIGLGPDEGFIEFANHDRDDVYDPLTVVRDTLVPVREQGTETQQARVEALLSFGEYTNTKYQEYTALAEGFSRLYRGIDAYLNDELNEAYEFFTEMREDLATISQRRVAADKLLDQFAADGVDTSIEPFSIADEQAEQTYVSTLVYRWEPAVRGLKRQIRGIGNFSMAGTAFEAGEYERCVRLARTARGSFETVEETISTALDRDASLFSSFLTLISCRSTAFIESARTRRAAGESGVAGNEQIANRKYESSNSQFEQAFRDCDGDSA